VTLKYIYQILKLSEKIQLKKIQRENLPNKKTPEGVLKVWAGVDCLESLALNVSTCFAFVIISLGKSTSHSARSSLEPDKAPPCCGSHPQPL